MVSDAQMQAQLERLPPGHPSSPWDADGRRRPPPGLRVRNTGPGHAAVAAVT